MFFNLACQNVEIIKFAILLNTEERRRGQKTGKDVAELSFMGEVDERV